MSKVDKAQSRKGRNAKRAAKRYDATEARKGRKEKTAEEVDRTPMNAPEWYASNPALLRDAASLPFNNLAGVPFWLDIYQNGEVVGQTARSFPGVMGIETVPVPGACYDPTSPVTVAARNIYSYVRHVNSGHSNYDSPNLMLYILAMDSLYATYSHLARMYGLIRTYALRNRYLPKTIFTAVGWNYEDFANNQAQFRYWLNTLVEKIGAMCVPAKMSYMMRHMWMYQNVFADAMSDKAQFFFYYPRVMYRYDALSLPDQADVTSDDIGSANPRPGLKVVEICTPAIDPSLGLRSFNDVRAAVDYAIETILSSEDLNIMSGDILKAFGTDGIWKLLPIHEEFEVIPQYSEEVLTQIHNLRSSGVPTRISGSQAFDNVSYGGASLSVSKKPLIFENVLAEKAYSFIRSASFTGTLTLANANTTILDLEKDDVSPEDVMVATRLTTVLTRAKDGNVQKVACGSELVTRCLMWTMAIGGAASGKVYPSYTILSSAQTIGQMQDILEVEAMACKFDLAPIRWYFFQNAENAINPWFFGGDITNFTITDSDVLARIHETALLSEFKVPLMGAWS